jgi:hypothetical protein
MRYAIRATMSWARKCGQLTIGLDILRFVSFSTLHVARGNRDGNPSFSDASMGARSGREAPGHQANNRQAFEAISHVSV